jgi:hypothetical protein
LKNNHGKDEQESKMAVEEEKSDEDGGVTYFGDGTEYILE